MFSRSGRKVMPTGVPSAGNSVGLREPFRAMGRMTRDPFLDNSMMNPLKAFFLIVQRQGIQQGQRRYSRFSFIFDPPSMLRVDPLLG